MARDPQETPLSPGTDPGVDPDLARATRESFARQGLLQTLGAQILMVRRGEVWLSAPITGAVSQQDGFAHAGLGWTLGDSAAGYAALTMMEPGDRVLTAEMKTNLMRPATGERIVARGRVIRPGRSLSTVQTDVFACRGDQESHVAVMLGTMARIPAD
ncbi:MAG: PaaI family thioesterase [Pseudomonadota bacterium]